MSDEIKTYQPQAIKSPGQVLRETLDELGISHSDFISISQIDRDYFYRFLAGRAYLSDEMAERLEKWAKLPAWVWKRHERQYRNHLDQEATT